MPAMIAVLSTSYPLLQFLGCIYPVQRSLYLLSLGAKRFDQDLLETYVNNFVHFCQSLDVHSIAITAFTSALCVHARM